MLNTAGRSQFRRSTTIGKVHSKGFLKMAREKMKHKLETIPEITASNSSMQHFHKRSQSSSFISIISFEHSPIPFNNCESAPSIAYIQKPRGDY